MLKHSLIMGAYASIYMFRYRCACAGLVRLCAVLKWYVEIEQFTKYIHLRYMECGLSLSPFRSDSDDNI